VDETGIGSVEALSNDPSRAVTAPGQDAQKLGVAPEPAGKMADALPATMPESPQPKLAIPSQPGGAQDATSQPSPWPPQPIAQESQSKQRNEEGLRQKQAMLAAVRKISRHVVRYDKNSANFINRTTADLISKTTEEFMKKAVTRIMGLDVDRNATAELKVILSIREEAEGAQPAASSDRKSVALSISARLQDLRDGATVTVWEHQQELGQVLPSESDPQKLQEIRKGLEEFFKKLSDDYRDAWNAQGGNAAKTAAPPTGVKLQPDSAFP
jgi:hypothetical protein